MTDASGINTDAYQADLQAAADQLVSVFPKEFKSDFKVYDFGFYLHDESYSGGYPEAFAQAIADVSAKSPYYLLFGKQTDHSGVYTKFWVDLKLPTVSDGVCPTEVQMMILEAKLANKVTVTYDSLGKDPFDYAISERLTMALLRDEMVEVSKCCDFSEGGCAIGVNPAEIKNFLTLNDFHYIDKDLVNLSTKPLEDDNSETEDVTLFTDLDFGLNADIQLKISTLKSHSHTGHGFIFSDINFENGTISTIFDAFNSSQTEYNIWYHVWKNPETNEYELYEKINEYDAFLKATTLSNSEYQDGLCGAKLWHSDINCDEPCHGTKRAGRCGSTWIYGNIEHWLIETDYVCHLNPFPTSKAEYMIPYSGKNGHTGYVDLVDLQTGEMFEIKPKNLQYQGVQEINHYLAMASLHCGSVTGWKAGTFYPPENYLPNPRNPTKALKITMPYDGVLVYKDDDTGFDPQPVVLPANVYDRIKRFMQRNFNDISEIELELEIARYLNENPQIGIAIRSAAVGLSIAVVVISILDDFTLVGILDDLPSFLIAGRLINIAMLPL